MLLSDALSNGHSHSPVDDEYVEYSFDDLSDIPSSVEDEERVGWLDPIQSSYLNSHYYLCLFSSHFLYVRATATCHFIPLFFPSRRMFMCIEDPTFPLATENPDEYKINIFIDYTAKYIVSSNCLFILILDDH